MGTGPPRGPTDRIAQRGFRRPDQRLEAPVGFDWSLEQEPYPWARVLGSSFLGNAVSVGLGYLMINRCMHIERTEFALSFKANCGRLYVLGTGLLSVGLPAVLLLRAETQENRASEIAGGDLVHRNAADDDVVRPPLSVPALTRNAEGPHVAKPRPAARDAHLRSRVDSP